MNAYENIVSFYVVPAGCVAAVNRPQFRLFEIETQMENIEIYPLYLENKLAVTLAFNKTLQGRLSTQDRKKI